MVRPSLHESAFTQFAGQAQRSAAMTFTRRHPRRRLPAGLSCPLRLARHPPDFPWAASTLVSASRNSPGGRPDTARSWPGTGARTSDAAPTVSGKLRRKLSPTSRGSTLALAAWAADPGSGEAADRYAQRLALSDEGALSLDRAGTAPHPARSSSPCADSTLGHCASPPGLC